MNKTLQDVLKKTGIKQGKYDNEKNRLYSMCKMSILMLDELWNQIDKAGLKNDNFVLDWLDSINEISVRN